MHAHVWGQDKVTSVHNKEDLKQQCCLPLQSCFLTPNDLLSVLNETQLAPSHAGVWGKTVSFTVLRDASVKTPCPWAEVKLSWHSVSGCGGQRIVCVGDLSLRLFTSVLYIIQGVWLRGLFARANADADMRPSLLWWDRRTELGDRVPLGYCISRHHFNISPTDLRCWC